MGPDRPHLSLLCRVVSALCLRKATCIFTVTKEKFGNPCPAVPKSLRLGYRSDAASDTQRWHESRATMSHALAVS